MRPVGELAEPESDEYRPARNPQKRRLRGYTRPVGDKARCERPGVRRCLAAHHSTINQARGRYGRSSTVKKRFRLKTCHVQDRRRSRVEMLERAALTIACVLPDRGADVTLT